MIRHNVGLVWEENCEEGETEGTIVNVGAGFAIAKDKVHQDKYFPSFEMEPLLKKRLAELKAQWDEHGVDGPLYHGHGSQSWGCSIRPRGLEDGAEGMALAPKWAT